MVRAFIALLLLLLPAAASASNTLAVRAGEHGDYSRLVIPNAPEKWLIATSDRKVEITFAGKDFDFDLSDIVDKRKAHRVLAARILDLEESRALVLSLTCDCPVRTSKSPNNSIIIDIFNEAPATLSEEETTTAPISEAAKQSTQASPESMRAARDRMIALLAEARHQGVVQLKIDDRRALENQAAQTDNNAHGQTATAPTQASHQQSANATHGPENLVRPEPLPEHNPIILSDHGANAANAGDRAHASEEQAESATCVDPTLFAEPDKKDGQINYSAISNLRQRFDLSENEDERNDIARTLALAYIHIGFFEEAGSVAASHARGNDGNMIVAAALSDFATGASARAATALAPYAHCGPLFEAAHAAAAGVHDNATVKMFDKHVAAVRALTPTLRGPLAETLSLNALETGENAIAKSFYETALDARNGEQTAALAIIERALSQHGDLAQHGPLAGAPATDAHGATPARNAHSDQQLAEIAQNPGPLQAKALSLLADDYRNRAQAAYDGLLDDISSQSANKKASLSDARASFTGAKALADAGRLSEGVAVLNAAARSAPPARPASQALARSMVMDALLKDDETRLEAVSAFFQHRDFITGANDNIENGKAEDADVNLAVARELAAFGANALVDDALSGAPSNALALARAQSDAVKALARLNSDDPRGALNIAANGAAGGELSKIAVRAHERIGDHDGAVTTIRTALAKGAHDDTFATAAWRAGDWNLTMDAFNAIPKDQRPSAAAQRAALAALNTKKQTLPAEVRETLSKDPAALAALTHMFVGAPVFNIRAIDVLADFSKGVKQETIFMQNGLSADGGK